MSCCRGRAIRTAQGQSSRNEPAQCKKLEQSGAALRLWPANSGGSYYWFLRDDAGQLLELRTYLGAHGCTGSTSQVLLSQLERSTKALNKSPAVFIQRATNGISLAELVKIVDNVLRSKEAPDGRKVPPFLRR